MRRFSLFLPQLTVLHLSKEPANAMERLVKNIVGPRESGYIKEQDLRKFLLTTFGSGIQFNIRVRHSMANTLQHRMLTSTGVIDEKRALGILRAEAVDSCR